MVASNNGCAIEARRTMGRARILDWFGKAGIDARSMIDSGNGSGTDQRSLFGKRSDDVIDKIKCVSIDKRCQIR